MKLSAKERDLLAYPLIASLHAGSEDTPEAIAKAWDEEIARRVAEMEEGKTPWSPAEDVMRDIRVRIVAAKPHAGQP